MSGLSDKFENTQNLNDVFTEDKAILNTISESSDKNVESDRLKAFITKAYSISFSSLPKPEMKKNWFSSIFGVGFSKGT